MRCLPAGRQTGTATVVNTKMVALIATECGLSSARQVLRLEAVGIEALANSLDDTFTRALDLLANVTGRIIVSGMGKSGHVARKVAASLATTGTPATFGHPA